MTGKFNTCHEEKMCRGCRALLSVQDRDFEPGNDEKPES